MNPKEPSGSEADLPKLFPNVLGRLLLFVVAVTACNMLIAYGNRVASISYFFFRKQDVFLAPVVVAGLWLLLGDRLRLPQRPFARMAAWNWRLLLPVLLFLLCYAGHYWLLAGYDNTRDEQMASFDAAIFAQGRLIWPIAQQWQPYAPALNQLFILPIGDAQAWVSAYLPVNAGLRALFAKFGDANLASPMFVALGAVGLWNCAALIWPGRRDVQVFAMLLYAGSGQIILTGMTAYAMSAHLALNLLWLNLWLLRHRRADLAAICIGFLATGLHQPIFHPMFVAPFLWVMWREKAWRRLAIFVSSYALIGAFWYGWPIWMSSLGTTSPPAGAIKLGYLERLIDELRHISPAALNLMLLNLLRFITWQHLLLLPLAVMGWIVAARQKDRLAMALGLGLLLPVLVMAIILPAQGHGWGYRYLHGVIGNAILLAGFAIVAATNKQQMRSRMLAGSLITALLLLPMQGWFMHRFYSSYAAQSARIDAAAAELAFMDVAPNAVDLVLNAPDLANRPIRLDVAKLKPADLAAICKGGRSAVFVSLADMQPLMDYLEEPVPATSLRSDDFRAAMLAAGCKPVSLPASF